MSRFLVKRKKMNILEEKHDVVLREFFKKAKWIQSCGVYKIIPQLFGYSIFYHLYYNIKNIKFIPKSFSILIMTNFHSLILTSNSKLPDPVRIFATPTSLSLTILVSNWQNSGDYSLFSSILGKKLPPLGLRPYLL